MFGLRWYQERNKVPTANEVRACAITKNLSMMDAKKFLLNATEPRLQFCDHKGQWHDVPFVSEERK